MAKKTTKRLSEKDRILNTALALAAEQRWRNVTLEMIVETSGIPLHRIRHFYRSKTTLVAAIIDRTSEAVLAGHDPADKNEPPRERLIDVLMRRFEALASNKKAVSSIIRDTISDPCSAFLIFPTFANAMAWSLDASGIGTSGLAGRVRIRGLSILYMSAIRVWLKDESEDLSATLAHLDRQLRLVESLILAFNRSNIRRPGG
ncbi:MAG: TetR/AcrR family transcriptional regulator [Pseudomonadota bacterium]|nr:TetR/AcrR family transcriptional regulator [Pseudomonadota bacterium]